MTRTLLIAALAAWAAATGAGAQGVTPPDWTLTQGLCPRIEGAIEDGLKSASLHAAEGDKVAVSIDLQTTAINFGQLSRIGCGQHLPDPVTTTRYANQARQCVADKARATAGAQPETCQMRNWKPEE